MQTLTQIKALIRKTARQTKLGVSFRGYQYTCSRVGVRKGAPIKMDGGHWIIVDPELAPFRGPEGYDQPAAEAKISALHTALLAAGLEATWGGRYCESVMVRVG
jgi:hypothetical protein